MARGIPITLHLLAGIPAPELGAAVARGQGQLAPMLRDLNLSAAIACPGDPGREVQWAAALVEAVIRSNDSDLISALGQNQAFLGKFPQLSQKLASTGRPGSHQPSSELPVLARPGRVNWAAARTTDPAWTGRGEVVDGLLASQRQIPRQAVVSPFPEVIKRVFKDHTNKLTPAEQLRGLLSLFQHAGPEAVDEVLGWGTCDQQVVSVAQRALAERSARRLSAATEHEEGTPVLIEQLLQLESGYPGRFTAVELVNARTCLDWEALVAAFQATPLTRQDSQEALLAQWDCPPDMLWTIFLTKPRDLIWLNWIQRVVRLARHVVSAEQTLSIGYPAIAVLGTVEDEATRDRLRELVNRKLGDHLPAWLAVLELLADHHGTVGELLDRAVNCPGQAQPSGATGERPWDHEADNPPDISAVPFDQLYETKDARPLGPRRLAYLTLLESAPEETVLRLLPALDFCSARDLLCYGTLTPALTENFPRHTTAREWQLLAMRDQFPPHTFQGLLATCDPNVAFALWSRTDLDAEQRIRIMTATLTFSGERTVPVRLPQKLRELVLSRPKQPGFYDLALGCGDAEAIRGIMEHIGVAAAPRQFRVVIGVWRRYGPLAVRELLDRDPQPAGSGGAPAKFHGQRTKHLDPTLEHLLSQLLKQPDQEGALRVLCAYALRRVLRSRNPLTIISTELREWDWQTVVAEHRLKPLKRHKLRIMAQLPGFPAELQLAFQIKNEIRKRELYVSDGIGYTSREQFPKFAEPSPIVLLSEGVPPAEVLAQYPLISPPSNYQISWQEQALETGLLSQLDLVRYGHPACRITFKDYEPETSELLKQRFQALALNPDAFLLALRMHQDFPGTIEELVATALAATS